MVREGYRVWFGKCNDFNLHGVFSRDRLDSDSRLWIWLSWFESRPPSQSFALPEKDLPFSSNSDFPLRIAPMPELCPNSAERYRLSFWAASLRSRSFTIL